jgi:hypothetical protein
VCLNVGAGLKINMDAAGGPALEIDQVASMPKRMVSEEIRLDPVPLDQTTIEHTLTAMPAAGDLLFAFYRGSVFWMWKSDVIRPIGKALTITLPLGRIAQIGDTIKLAYWTYDPMFPAVQPLRP